MRQRDGQWIRWMILGCSLTATWPCQAIGPQNVLIITTTKSPQGLAVANYYREKRGIPAINVVRTRIEPTDRMNSDVFRKTVADVAESHARKYGLQKAISVWATTCDMPTIIAPDNSISGAIFFGDRIAPSYDPASKGQFSQENPFFDKMLGYRRPENAAGGYLHMRIDASTLPETLALIDRSRQADGSFPQGMIYLYDGEGPRNVRREAIPSAMRLIKMLELPVEHRLVGMLSDATDVLGWHTGVPTLMIDQNRYVPGALADHLTSFGGSIVNKHQQTGAIEFLRNGCSATYGTVVEPYNYVAKFPVPHLFGYYGLGFTAVESYWMSVRWPHQGLFMGDPLTRPFEKPISITVQRLRPEEVVKGTIDFDVSAEVSGPGSGIRGIEVNIGESRLHQRGFADIPENTRITLDIFGKKVEYVTLTKEPLGSLVGNVAAELNKSGLQIGVKPGMIVILPPAGSTGSEACSAVSSSPILRAELLGNPADRPAPVIELPTSADIPWQLEGTCGEGDRFTLTIREDGAEVAKISQVVTFARPASSLCTSLYIEASKSLPKGYKLEPTLDPGRADFGVLTLIAEGSRATKKVTASLDHEAKPDSKLTIKGAGSPTALAANGRAGKETVGIRFGLGPAKLRTKPIIDTTKFPDGRHKLILLSARGGATDSSQWIEFPIVIQNKKPRVRLEEIKAPLRASQPGKVPIAKILAAKELPGRARFRIDGNEVGALDVAGDTLSIEPAFWGAGKHEVEAEWVDGPTIIQRADNALLLTIDP
ncbi:TIGR03790 family protein [bacterium]|nr:TIGR03790 family protein [bacterium]